MRFHSFKEIYTTLNSVTHTLDDQKITVVPITIQAIQDSHSMFTRTTILLKRHSLARTIHQADKTSSSKSFKINHAPIPALQKPLAFDSEPPTTTSLNHIPL
jgi:hypothetical protein